MSHRAAGALLLAMAAALLVACTSGPGADAAGRLRFGEIDLDGSRFNTRWYLPARPDRGHWVLLQPGFTRHCGHLGSLSRRLMAQGLTVLCIDAPMGAGAAGLAAALAQRLTSELNAPDGARLPPALIVAGHSAGARFALRLGAELQALAPQRLAGAMLFDPVATPGFESDLRAVLAAGRRPLLALLAPPHACNAQGNARAALQALAQPPQRLQLQTVDGGSHADAEGEDSDWIARSACGSPGAEAVARVQETAAAWTLAVTRSAQTPAD